jgi:hypothetical protein
MNERIAFGAMALLLAAGLLTQSRSPAFAALTGTYVATTSAGESSERHVLVLAGDGTATLRTESPDGSVIATETGAWLLDGTSVQTAFKGVGSDGARGLTFVVKDGTLVGAGTDALASRFATVIFTKMIVDETTQNETH